MSKLFIGMPRGGRTEENYKNSLIEAGKMANIVFGEKFSECELSTIDCPLKDGETFLMRFAKNCEKLSECSHAIFFSTWDSYGNELEMLKDISNRFNRTNTIYFNVEDVYFTRDILEVIKERHSESLATCDEAPCTPF